jgi:hypothetical protein
VLAKVDLETAMFAHMLSVEGKGKKRLDYENDVILW